MKIGSVSENQKIEKRISITPEIAKKYISIGFEVHLSKNYGVHLGISDEEFKNLGVKFSDDENEVLNLMALAKFLKETFAVNYAKGQQLKTSTTKKGYHNNYLIDEDLNSYWVSHSKDQTPTIELRLETPVELNTFMIQEYLPLGQRIKSFKVEILLAIKTSPRFVLTWFNFVIGSSISKFFIILILIFAANKLDYNAISTLFYMCM